MTSNKYDVVLIASAPSEPDPHHIYDKVPEDGQPPGDHIIPYRTLEDQGFERIGAGQILGAGSFGIAELFTYTGTDPKILALCNDKQIVLKFQKEPDLNEIRVASLLGATGDISPATERYNITAPVEIILDSGSTMVFIASSYETYQTESDRVAANLERFLTSSNPGTRDKNMKAAFRVDAAIMLAQLANEMRASQDALHQRGIIHNDTAARNFLVVGKGIDGKESRDGQGYVISLRTRIADYGLSIICAQGQTDYPIKVGTRLPIAHLAQEAFAKRAISMQTDFYALRVTMIAIAALSISQDPKDFEERYLFKIGGSPDSITREQRKAMSDEEAVELNFAVVRLKISQSCDDISRVEELNLYLDCYKSYFMTFPKATEPEKAMEEDRALLIEANERFVRGALVLLEKRFEDSVNTDLARYRVSLLRLRQIEVVDSALNEEINKRINDIKTQLSGPVLENIDAVILSPILTKEQLDLLGNLKMIITTYSSGDHNQNAFIEMTMHLLVKLYSQATAPQREQLDTVKDGLEQLITAVDEDLSDKKWLTELRNTFYMSRFRQDLQEMRKSGNVDDDDDDDVQSFVP